MLNYLGPNIGSGGPIATQLPPATPGTMPQSVPGVPPVNTLPPAPPMPMGGGHPAIHGRGAPSPAALAAIMQHVASGGGIGMTPKPPEYAATTQADGSILLHIKGPNGELGPVVKVIPALKKANPTG